MEEVEQSVQDVLGQASFIVYGVLLAAFAISLPLVTLVEVEHPWQDIEIYQAFLIYVVGVSTILHILSIVRYAVSIKTSDQSDVAQNNLRPFGTTVFRYVACLISLAAMYTLAVELSWESQRFMKTDSCSADGADVAFIVLALLHTIMHPFIIYQNVKVLGKSPGVAGFSIVHYAATDFALYLWLIKNFIVTDGFRLEPHIESVNEDEQKSSEQRIIEKREAEQSIKPILKSCDMDDTILKNIRTVSMPYVGIGALLFFHMAAALLANLYVHYRNTGSVVKISVLATEHRYGSKQLKLFSSAVGWVIGLFCIGIALAIVVYYNITLSDPEKTWFSPWVSLEGASIVFSVVACAVCIALLVVLENSNKKLLREVRLESFILGTCLAGAFLWAISTAAAHSFQNDTTGYVTVAARAVEMVELSLQAALVLTALQYYAALLPNAPRRLYGIHQSSTLYLLLYNLAMVLFCFMRHRQSIFGKIYQEAFGPWIWPSALYILGSLTLLCRLYTALCFGTIWFRAFVSDD